MSVKQPKSVMQTFRITLALKEALRQAAREEHRSIGNLIEFVLLRLMEERGIRVGQPGDPEAARLESGKRGARRVPRHGAEGNEANAPPHPGQRNPSRQRK